MESVRAYLDTCLVSALVKHDIDAHQMTALKKIFEMYHSGRVSLGCSTVVEDELKKIPSQFAGPHLNLLNQFRDLPKATVGGLTRLGPAGFPMANPKRRLWKSLNTCLPDEPDAWHVFVAAMNRYGYLVTVDHKTMLSHTDAVFAACGVRIISPVDFIGEVENDAC